MSGLKMYAKLPKWKPYPVVKGDKSRAAKWSGKGAPPAIGDLVNVSINGIGQAQVLAYFIESGYLGLYVRPTFPPAWYVKQNGHGAACHVFGAELNEVQS